MKIMSETMKTRDYMKTTFTFNVVVKYVITFGVAAWLTVRLNTKKKAVLKQLLKYFKNIKTF